MTHLVSRLQHCSGQPSLDLSHIDLSSEGDAKSVVKSIYENKFVDIDLSVCGITSDVLRTLASSLRKNTQLQYLFLNNNSIDSTGITTITGILRGNKNIESINLRGNQLFPAEITYTEDDEEDQSEIEELVETCCELQNLKSICGCGEFNQEIVVSATGSDSELYSDILLLGIELKLGVDLTSLQYWGSVGLSEVFEALKDNRTVLHAQFNRFQEGTIDFDSLLTSCLQSNSNLKSLQFAFEPFDASNTVGYGKLQQQQQAGKNTLIAIWNSLENNVGVTSLQLDAWARDADTTAALAVLLRKNATLLHLSLFHTALLVEDLVMIAHSLEYNNTLRVLSVNKTAYIAGDTSNGRTSPNHLTQSSGGRSTVRGSKIFKMKPPPAGTNLLIIPEVRARFEAAYKARKVPFIIRTEEEDFVFGPAQLLSLPAALQWEVGDTVQVRVDHEEFTQYHQHHQQQDLSSSTAHNSAENGRKEGNWEEGEGWVEGTVWAVHADQRYTVKINTTGQVRFSLRASSLRAGENFHRLTELNRVEPAPVTSNHHHFNPNESTSRVMSPEPGAEPNVQAATISAETADNHAPVVPQQQLAYPVIYPPGIQVEVRYLGDAAWLPGTVVSADQQVLPATVTVEVRLPLESVLEALISIKGSKAKDMDKLDPAESKESKSVMVTVRDVVEMETCFVRPVVPESASSKYSVGQKNEHLYSPARAEVLKALNGKPYYDAGAYMRGDYVEVRLFLDPAVSTSTPANAYTHTSTDASPVRHFEWKRGRVSLDRKNGTFDVRMETGVDLSGIRGCHLRHHFRPRDVVDCRLPVSLPAFLTTPGDAQPVLPELHKSVESTDKNESVVMSSVRTETHHSLHRTPLTLSQAHLTPLPAPSSWVPALVLKQERSGLFSVSFQDSNMASVTSATSDGTRGVSGSNNNNAKGVSSARLMPANRAHVRKTCEDMRVIAQLWPISAQDASNSGTLVADAAERENEQNHSQQNQNETEYTSQPSPARPHSVELSAAVSCSSHSGDDNELSQNNHRLASVQEESSQLSTQSYPNSSEKAAKDEKNDKKEEENERVTQLEENLQQSLSVSAGQALSPVRPVPVNPVHPSSTVSAVETLPSTAGVTAGRALISAFDINDRVEVCQNTNASDLSNNNNTSWLAGRVEGIHNDNCTYIVRYVDGRADQAVPLRQMRRASAATPLRAGSRILDKSAANPVVAAERQENQPVPHPTPVRPVLSVPNTVAETVAQAPSHANANVSEFYRPDNNISEVTDTPWVGKQLFPPFRSPEPAQPTPSTPHSMNHVAPLHSDIRAGAWLSIYNATLECFEPCLVDAVYPTEGQFDATNRRGEVYRRIDPRYIEPNTSAILSAPHSVPHSGFQSGMSSVAPTPASQARFLPSPSPAQGPAQSLFSAHHSLNSLHTHASFNQHAANSTGAVYKIGTPVEVSNDGALWVRGIVVKKLSPQIYTVYVEDTAEECTVVVSQIRSVGMNIVQEQGHHNQGYPTQSTMPFYPHLPSVSSEFGYMDVTEGSLDGSLDDDELVVVGTGLNAGFLNEGDANSIVEASGHPAFELEHYGQPVGVSIEEASQEVRRPHTAPHPPYQSKSSSQIAHNRTERSSSANRQDKYNNNNNNTSNPHHVVHHHSSKSEVVGHSASPAAHIFPLTSSTLEEDQLLPLMQKPVTISARLSSHDSAGDLSTLQGVHVDPHHSAHSFIEDTAADPEREYRLECGVCYRSHTAPLAPTPLVAYLHTSGRGVGDASVDIAENTVITVVPYSDHAVFGDGVDKIGYSFAYRSSNNNGNENEGNCVLLSMHVSAMAPEVVPVKVSFYVNTIIISEVCFNVLTSASSASKSRSASKSQGRSASTPLSLRAGANSANAKASGASSVWRRAIADVFHNIVVVTVDLPTQVTPESGNSLSSSSGSDRLRRGASGARHKMVSEEVAAGIALLPSCVNVAHHVLSANSEASVVVTEALQGASRVQVFVFNAIDGDTACLTRDLWLSLLRTHPVLDSFVKTAIAEFRSSGHVRDGESASSEAFFLNRLAICTPIVSPVSPQTGTKGNTAVAQDTTHRDWLFSVGLSPFNLEQLMCYHGHNFLQTLWTFASAAAPSVASPSNPRNVGFELTLKVRFVSSLRAVQRLFSQLIQAIAATGEANALVCGLPQGLLLLPGLLAKFGFQNGHTRLPVEQLTATLQKALDSLFTIQEAPQHNEDSSPMHEEETNDVRSALQLYAMCDSLGRSDSVALQQVSSGALQAEQAFTLAPLLKAVSALSIAHSVAVQLDIPLSNNNGGCSCRGVHQVAHALPLEELLVLHEFYSLIEYGYLHWKYGSSLAHGEIGATAPTLLLRASPVLVSAEQTLERAVTHLENALLGLQQHDLSRTVSVVQALMLASASPQADVHVVRVGENTHWLQSAEYKKNWHSLTDISHSRRTEAGTRAHPLYSVVEVHVVDALLVEANSAEDANLACEMSPYRALTATCNSPHRPQSHNHHRNQQALDSTSPEAQLTLFLSEQVGIKDSFSAQEAASCLMAMGCTSCEDFASMGSLFTLKKGQVDGDKLRGFLNEGGIPLFIAAKLAAFVVNKTAHF